MDLYFDDTTISGHDFLTGDNLTSIMPLSPAMMNQLHGRLKDEIKTGSKNLTGFIKGVKSKENMIVRKKWCSPENQQ